MTHLPLVHDTERKTIRAATRQEAGRWLYNRAATSHLPFRRRQVAMQRFASMRSLQQFAFVRAPVYRQYNHERSFSSRPNFMLNRGAALAEWRGLCAG